MIANRIVRVIGTPVGIVLLPVQIVTTLVGGILVGCTFGLLLLPLSLIWLVFLGVLLGTSWLWDKAAKLRYQPFITIARILIDVVGIPSAIVAAEYVALVPSMGEIESRTTKMNTCWAWPFSLDYWRFGVKGDPVLTTDDSTRYARLLEVLRVPWPRQLRE